MIDHELTHVVTMYPAAPGWLSEGIADWVRSEAGGEREWVNYHCRGDETYADGYGCAAALLRFAERRVPGTIRALHARLRSEPFDGRIAGVAVEDLWQQCRAEGTCLPR